MIGWNISVYLQETGGAEPATAESEPGSRIAVWQTGAGGLEWLHALVKQGHAIDLLGNGYPNRYTAQAKQLLPVIAAGPPCANQSWICGKDDVIGSGWAGETTFDEGLAHECAADEWLMVVAWDES
jgi:hypothetical protein